MSTAAEPQRADGVVDPENAASGEEVVESFYASVVDQAELASAMAVKGMDQEIGLLRVQLRKRVTESPEDLELMLKSINLIVRATQARYRMSAQSREDLVGAITDSLKGIADQVMPMEVDDV